MYFIKKRLFSLKVSTLMIQSIFLFKQKILQGSNIIYICNILGKYIYLC